MRSRTSLAVLPLIIVVICQVLANQVWAQSAQYQRPTTKKSTTTPSADGSAATTTQSTTDGSSDKLDLSDIEKKYWAPKDTDFTVVQNRLYTKAHRFALTAGYGMTVNDSYNNGDNYELMLNYYFNERYGMQLTYIDTISVDNNLTTAFRQENGVMPDYNKITGFYGASFNWVPFYAKMSFLNSHIMYFDMSISPGIGNTQYMQQLAAGSTSANSMTYTLDLTQQLFISKTFAFRFDFQNHWFNETRLKYQTTASSAGGTSVGDDFNHTIILLFGLTVFY